MSKSLKFGRFELRPSERSLLADGDVLPLGARAFDVLLALAERHDRVVSKNELLDLAWPGLVVEENNLTVQISALRKVLGAASIATVTGRGYRLAYEFDSVRVVADAAEPRPNPGAAAAAPRLQRRLVAIVSADVVGWSRLVARDATLAARTWRSARVELIEPTLPQFGGRVSELTAERLLADFSSAVEAVAWALALQSRLAERRNAADENGTQLLHMRIGISVDDAIIDDGKLISDGVNVAADLQLSAGHDDVLVTQKVRDFAFNKLEAVFEPLGERLMRRTQRPMQVFRVAANASTFGANAVHGRPALRVASLAVLPFVGPAIGDSTQADAYFSAGVTEEIIATLSLNSALFVIAHNSTLRFRQRTDDLAGVAAELGVRYLVTGTVRSAGTQLRIHVQLLHAADQRILWQERFDGGSDDLFGFQSRIASSVAAAIAPPVQDEEVARVRQRPTASYGAYDCVLRALAGIYQLGTNEFDTAGQMLKRAVELDPEYAQAHAHLAWWYSLRTGEGHTAMQSDEARLALEHALQAVRLDGRDAWTLSVAGYMLTLRKKQHAQALDMFDQALAINPSCAAAWARSAATLSYLGRADESIERVRRAMALSPFDQHMFWFLTIHGGACFVGGRFDEAVAWLGKALRLNPNFNGARRMQIASLVQVGEMTEARELARELQADWPNFSLREFAEWSPMQQPHLDHMVEALRRAGLPD